MIRSATASFFVIAAFIAAAHAEPGQLFERISESADSVQATINADALSELKTIDGSRSIVLPLPAGGFAAAKLSRFDVIGPTCKIVAMTANGPVTLPRPNVATFRGSCDR
jgi:hypothetical protein